MSWQRLLGWLVPFALLVLLGRCAQTVLDSPNFDWAGARLMPLVTFAEGGRLYMPAHQGPVYNTIYSPLSYLLYLPVLASPEPAAMIAAASALGLLFYFGPVLLLAAPFGVRCRATALDEDKNPKRCRATALQKSALFVAPILLFGLISYQSRALRMSLEGTIHDCPTLGLAVIACIIAYHDQQARRLAWSALFAILAVWSKQVMLPLLLALPLTSAFLHGWRVGLRHLGWMLLGISISALSFTLLTERQSFWFNVFTLPGHHPWIDTFPGNFASVAYHLYEETWLAFLAVGMLVCLERPWRDLTRQRWFLFVIVALLQIPTAFLGRIKVGGSSNSFSPVLYFLLLALLAYLIEFLRDPQRPAQLVRGVGIALNGAVTALALLQLLQSATFLKSYPGPGRSKEQRVVNYLRAHPGEAYFPWNPLSHQAAEGRTCHFAYGLFDRELAGFAIDDEHVNRHRPPHCRYVCFPPGRRHHRSPECLERLMREYPRRVEIDDLPGFECYERPP